VAESGPSVLDFVRGVSPDGDRAVHVASLLRDLDRLTI
jgi:hypothetical protein